MINLFIYFLYTVLLIVFLILLPVKATVIQDVGEQIDVSLSPSHVIIKANAVSKKLNMLM